MYYPWAAWWWWFAWVIPILVLFWAFAGWGRRWDNGYGYGYGSSRLSRNRSSNGDWRTNGNKPARYRNRGPRNYQRSDDRIFDDVCTLLMASDELDPSALDVRVLNGEVTLTGTVESRFEKRLAERLADSPPGVTDVNNQLRIGPVDHSTPARPQRAPESHQPLPNA